MRRFLEWLCTHLPRPRVIYDRAGERPYLSRYYLVGAPHMPDGSEPIDRFGNPKPEAIFPPGWGLYLHHFHRSDDDVALHNHPWTWARALILAGGYLEERRMRHPSATCDMVMPFLRRPGSWVRVDADDFHRVDLLERDSWSLFLAGPKVSEWFFWDRETGETVHWREFIDRLRGKVPPPPVWDDKPYPYDKPYPFRWGVGTR